MRLCKYSKPKYKSFYFIYELAIDDVCKKGSRLYLDAKNEPSKKVLDKHNNEKFLADEKETIKSFMKLRIRKVKK